MPVVNNVETQGNFWGPYWLTEYGTTRMFPDHYGEYRYGDASYKITCLSGIAVDDSPRCVQYTGSLCAPALSGEYVYIPMGYTPQTWEAKMKKEVFDLFNLPILGKAYR